MMDVDNNTKDHPAEVRVKNSLPYGIATTEPFLRQRKSLIPTDTPGKDIPIRPRSPFRDIKGEDNWSKNSPDKDSMYINGSVQNSPDKDSACINSSIRSVYEISGDKHKKSPTRVPSDRLSPDRASPEMGYPPPYQMPPYPGYLGYPGYPGYPYTGMPHMHYPPPPPPPQIEAQSTMPDYKSMSDEDKNEARLIFKTKFNALRETYPEKSFAEYDENLPLKHIHTVYENYLRKIDIEASISITEVVLTMIFFGIEWFVTSVLKVDMTGYAKTQVSSMKKYNSLLIQLGEKYSDSGGNWPVEMRLILLAMFNAFVIIMVRLFCNRTGATNAQWIIDTISNTFGGHIDSVIDDKPPKEVDPITKTPDVKPADRRDLMGNVQNLMSMARQFMPSSESTTENVTMASSPNKSRSPKSNKPKVRFGRKN